MSALSDLRDCQSTIDSAWSIVAAPLLTAMIDKALGVPAPDGSPAAISAQGSAYLKAGATCKQVADRLNDVASNKLPAAWRGDAAENASQAVVALTAEAMTAGNVLVQAGRTLQTWADNLRTAQRDDSSGRDTLQSAKSHLGPLGGWLSGLIEITDPAGFAVAVETARVGIASMVNAASLAQNSGEATAGTLTYLADQARAERLTAGGLDPVDAVVLAGAQNAASDGGGDILTAAELTRASQLMDGMSPALQREFDELLANSKSTEEAAYLIKALAAGHSLSDVEKFDALIHSHGDDVDWLSKHLAPDLSNGTATYDGVSWFHWPGMKPGYGYNTYDQKNIGDCVAASTVVALANLDPVYMLKLTTGDQPGAPGADSVSSFVHRLQTAYVSNYQTGQRADGDSGVYPKVDGGLGSTGENALANSDLGTATGTPYHYVSLNGTGDNQAALTQVEKAVDSGQPVPIDVTGPNSNEGHQMVIIASNGGSLKIYNPWGYSGWVTNQQFLNNQLGALTSSQPPPMPTATGLELPSS